MPFLIEELLESEARCERGQLASRGTRRRRHIGREAGRALEILGHAIEYLADEYVHAGMSFRSSDPEVEAIQLLMKLNRQVYFECPEVPTLAERLHKLITRARRS